MLKRLNRFKLNKGSFSRLARERRRYTSTPCYITNIEGNTLLNVNNIVSAKMKELRWGIGLLDINKYVKVRTTNPEETFTENEGTPLYNYVKEHLDTIKKNNELNRNLDDLEIGLDSLLEDTVNDFSRFFLSDKKG